MQALFCAIVLLVEDDGVLEGEGRTLIASTLFLLESRGPKYVATPRPLY
jgi:hypothetical protein